MTLALLVAVVLVALDAWVSALVIVLTGFALFAMAALVDERVGRAFDAFVAGILAVLLWPFMWGTR